MLKEISNLFSSPTLEDQVFELKFTARTVEREALKCKSQEAKEKKRVVEALKKNNKEVAQTYAENAVRNHNQYIKLTQLAAKVSAIQSRVQQADQQLKITKSIGSVSSQLKRATKQLDLEKMSKLMDDFEKEFDNVDAKTSVLDGAMNKTTALSAPSDQITSLLKECADEANIELNTDLPDLGLDTSIKVPTAQQQNQLSDTLADRRNQI